MSCHPWQAHSLKLNRKQSIQKEILLFFWVESTWASCGTDEGPILAWLQPRWDAGAGGYIPGQMDMEQWWGPCKRSTSPWVSHSPTSQHAALVHLGGLGDTGSNSKCWGAGAAPSMLEPWPSLGWPWSKEVRIICGAQCAGLFHHQPCFGCPESRVLALGPVLAAWSKKDSWKGLRVSWQWGSQLGVSTCPLHSKGKLHSGELTIY